jgi:hypothetical protein
MPTFLFHHPQSCSLEGQLSREAATEVTSLHAGVKVIGQARVALCVTEYGAVEQRRYFVRQFVKALNYLDTHAKQTSAELRTLRDTAYFKVIIRFCCHCSAESSRETSNLGRKSMPYDLA